MLKQEIQSDSIGALKKRNKEISEVLRMVLSTISLKEKEKRYKLLKDLPAQAGKPDLKEEDLLKESELSDEEIVSVLSSEIKKRKDAIVLYEKGGRQDLSDKERKEIEILQKYLPDQLSSEELENLISESVKKLNAKNMKEMGKVMADLAPKIKGRADGATVSKILKGLLS